MNLQQKIMLRVYCIWFFRRVTPVFVFQILFLVLAVHLFAQSVFVARVAATTVAAFDGGFFYTIIFMAKLLWHAKLAVKVEIVAMLILGYYMLKYLKKAIVAYELMKRN